MSAPRNPPEHSSSNAKPDTVSPLGARRVGSNPTEWAEWDTPSLDAPSLGQALDELERKTQLASMELEPELDPLTWHRLMLLMSTVVGILAAAGVVATGWLLLS